ncbi:hypothetical protein B0J11DRAFT_582505 [Dendryphion nanum]|uniref:Uncharacterized protein n=1 Tax=Dendryphion nanum TaxID=256645 RepID=A0A9P9II05_9PLEO|nr:hypothetical protein B0J11DRAFT_582505 [Dendryphion nanum]
MTSAVLASLAPAARTYGDVRNFGPGALESHDQRLAEEHRSVVAGRRRVSGTVLEKERKKKKAAASASGPVSGPVPAAPAAASTTTVVTTTTTINRVHGGRVVKKTTTTTTTTTTETPTRPHPRPRPRSAPIVVVNRPVAAATVVYNPTNSCSSSAITPSIFGGQAAAAAQARIRSRPVVVRLTTAPAAPTPAAPTPATTTTTPQSRVIAGRVEKKRVPALVPAPVARRRVRATPALCPGVGATPVVRPGLGATPVPVVVSPAPASAGETKRERLERVKKEKLERRERAIAARVALAKQ